MSEIGHTPLIERAPLVYGPDRTPAYNHVRLPPDEAMEDMALAYRPLLDPERTHHRGFVLLASVTILAASAWFLLFLFTFVATRFPQTAQWMIGVGASVSSIGLLLFFALSGRLSPATLVVAIWFPIGFLTTLFVHAYLLNSRELALLALGTAAVLAISLALLPFRFHDDWLWAHPRLTSEQRRRRARFPMPFRLLLGALSLPGCMSVAATAPRRRCSSSSCS